MINPISKPNEKRKEKEQQEYDKEQKQLDSIGYTPIKPTQPVFSDDGKMLKGENCMKGLKTCPYCKYEFVPRSSRSVTCDKEQCKRQYKNEQSRNNYYTRRNNKVKEQLKNNQDKTEIKIETETKQAETPIQQKELSPNKNETKTAKTNLIDYLKNAPPEILKIIDANAFKQSLMEMDAEELKQYFMDLIRRVNK